MRLTKKYEFRVDLLSHDLYGSVKHVRFLLAENRVTSWNELALDRELRVFTKEELLKRVLRRVR